MKLMIINRPELTAMLMAALLSLFSCKKDSKETGPAITGFSSDTVWIGKTITINGSGFGATAADNTIHIGNTAITEIIEASATSLTIKVPAGAASAKVFVRVNGKEFSSSRELIIVNQMAWQKAFGGSRDDDGVAIAPVANGGYLLAGSALSSDGDVSNNYGGSDLWVVKVNADRSIAWQKVFGGSGTDGATSIVALADGSCVVAGYTTSTDGDGVGNHGGNDYFIIKLDAGGKVLWKRVLGGTGTDAANAVVATPTGYVIAGYTSSTDGDVSGNHGAYDYWIVWLDANGALINQKTYGGIDTDQASSLTTTSDGGYLVAGAALSKDGDVTGNHGAYDFWILKLNAAGSITWQKALGGTGGDRARSIISTADGSSYIAGSTSSTDGDVTGNHGSDDYWIVKLNANGSMAWQKALGGSLIDQAMEIAPARDGGCAVTGLATSSDGDITANRGKSDSWIVRLNATGSVVWQKTLGGTNSEISSGIAATGNSFTVIGRSNSSDGDVSGLHGTTRPDFWLFNILD